MVPGLLLFCRRRVVRGLVRGCHGVDWHYVDEAVDFVNDTLVARFLRPVEATHCLLVCAALNEGCVCGREAKLDGFARFGVGVDIRVVGVHDHLPFFRVLFSCAAPSIAHGLAVRTYELTHFVTRGGEGVDALCEAAARESGEETRTWLASWTDTPEAAARVLAGDKVWSVRRALADNVFAPGDVLDALAQDADGRVSERAEVSQAYVRSVRDHNGDDAALYQEKAERAARVADERVRATRERVRATRERVERDAQERLSAVRERRERCVRDYFWSNYSEFPNSSRRRDASRGWDDSRGGVAPGNKPIVFMSEGEMVELASSPGLSYKDQNSLVVFGGERVHLALARRDDLCDDAQMALAVHGDGCAQVVLARRRSLSERVQVALAVHGDFAARSVLAGRGDLCGRARRLVS